MKKLHTFMAAVLAFGAGTLVDTEVLYAQASSVGQLRGVVKDKGTNENAVGATVVATSPALQGEQVVITDENGQYFITALPAGMYDASDGHAGPLACDGSRRAALAPALQFRVPVDARPGTRRALHRRYLRARRREDFGDAGER